MLFGENVCVGEPFATATQRCQENGVITEAVITNFYDESGMEEYTSFIGDINRYCLKPLKLNKLNCEQLKQQISDIDKQYKSPQFRSPKAVK
jgi:hypothetical protein